MAFSGDIMAAHYRSGAKPGPPDRLPVGDKPSPAAAGRAGRAGPGRAVSRRTHSRCVIKQSPSERKYKFTRRPTTKMAVTRAILHGGGGGEVHRPCYR